MHNRLPYQAPALVLSLVLLSGCFPVKYEYLYLDPPTQPAVTDVKHIPLTCRSYGPPGILQYRMGELLYEIGLSEEYYKGYAAHIELRAPEKSAVYAPDSHADLFDMRGQKVATVELHSIASDRSPDGRLSSRLEPRRGYVLYRFALSPIPQFPDKGALRIPAFRVDDMIAPGHEVHFERRSSVDFVPLNC